MPMQTSENQMAPTYLRFIESKLFFPLFQISDGLF